MPKGFMLSDYDFVGFDLDNTLAQYNLTNFLTSNYEFMISHLSSLKYEGLDETLTSDDLNFCCRGLFIDLDRGNLLKASKSGLILKATHGTDLLTTEEIRKQYGRKMKFKSIPLSVEERVKRRPVSERKARVYPAWDFPDVINSLIYARLIDLYPNNRLQGTWMDLVGGLYAMYDKSGPWAEHYNMNPDLYLDKANKSLITWLKMLHNSRYTAMITASPPDSADKTATQTLGTNWRDLFHFSVYESQKPSFFMSRQNFRHAEMDDVPTIKFNLYGEYCGGSFYLIEKSLHEKLGRKPRSIYFGDSPIADLYHSATDTVAIINESMVEGYFPGTYPHSDFLKSDVWGSIFDEGKSPTFLKSIVMKSKFCAPDLDYFTHFPNNYPHIPFWKESNN